MRLAWTYQVGPIPIIDATFETPLITDEMVRKILNGLGSSKATGPDGLLNELLIKYP
jgi:hypothetical protein